MIFQLFHPATEGNKLIFQSVKVELDAFFLKNKDQARYV